jgi:hypothetical protein
VKKKHYHPPINISENGFFVNNKPPRGKPWGIFKGKIHFTAAPLGGISALLQQAAGN